MLARISDVTATAGVIAKLNQKHNLALDDVLAALNSHDRKARWHEDPERGRRLLVIAQTRAGRTLSIVLYPVDEKNGTYRLASAY